MKICASNTDKLLLSYQNDNKMIQIDILKNGKSVRTFYCTEKDFQVKNHYARSIAGGMWNGKDRIEVRSKSL